MQQPPTILARGTLVRTHKTLGTTTGMVLAPAMLVLRRPDALGRIHSVVLDPDSDVYWVEHSKNEQAPYCFDELELVPFVSTSKAERAYAVVTHERFFQAEWQHKGHTAPECRKVGDKGGPCRTFAVGVRYPEEARVRWIIGHTAETVLEQAAKVLVDGESILGQPDYAG